MTKLGRVDEGIGMTVRTRAPGRIVARAGFATVVLAAMLAVPRHVFVDSWRRALTRTRRCRSAWVTIRGRTSSRG
jgi:hypothetical protein